MTVRKNIERIKSEIGAAVLVAVSKQQPEEKIRAALEAGQRVFGENRVQEAQKRWGPLLGACPDLVLHLVGPLQTNKAADAVALFDMIQSVDREKLARILGDEMKKQGRNIPCLVQVNTGGEEQKSGIAPEALADFLAFCRVQCGLEIAGLMCIPPVDEDPRPHFMLLKNLAGAHGLKELSMGMSGDYRDAIGCGATMVRIGSALFGPRGN